MLIAHVLARLRPASPKNRFVPLCAPCPLRQRRRRSLCCRCPCGRGLFRPSVRCRLSRRVARSFVRSRCPRFARPFAAIHGNAPRRARCPFPLWERGAARGGVAFVFACCVACGAFSAPVWTFPRSRPFAPVVGVFSWRFVGVRVGVALCVARGVRGGVAYMARRRSCGVVPSVSTQDGRRRYLNKETRLQHTHNATRRAPVWAAFVLCRVNYTTLSKIVFFVPVRGYESRARCGRNV